MSGTAQAQFEPLLPKLPGASCWETPAPQTVEEVAIVMENRGAFDRRVAETRSTSGSAMLALSDGGTKLAYGAGLLVGWRETGRRPDFKVVTAVGLSALLAPFAFLGEPGDQPLADLMSCGHSDWKAIAAQAAAMIDQATADLIARKHRDGGRLLIALIGSPVRDEVVWDLGAIAASGHPEAVQFIRTILLHAVDPLKILETKSIPIAAHATAIERNWAFRKGGAGEAFLGAETAFEGIKSYYLVHNAVFFDDEIEDYKAWRKSTRKDMGLRPQTPLVTAHDLQSHANARNSRFHIINFRSSADYVAASNFDSAYMAGMFKTGFRRARMGIKWMREVTGPRDD